MDGNMGEHVQRGWLVTYGTQAVIVRADTGETAAHLVAQAWCRVNGRDSLYAPTMADLSTREVRPGEFRDTPYWSGRARDESTLVGLFNPDEPVT